jgi:hypothetical protein
MTGTEGLLVFFLLAGGLFRLLWFLVRALGNWQATDDRLLASRLQHGVTLGEWLLTLPLHLMVLLVGPLFGDRLQRLCHLPTWPRTPRMRGPRAPRLREFREPAPWTKGPLTG